MEADWELEIDGEAPVIDAAWSGLVDLRAEPERVSELSEVALLPGLADVLVQLNGPESPMWTAKCDVWSPDSYDPDELDAPAAAAVHFKACYIDLLPRSEEMWVTLEAAADWCRRICGLLRDCPLRQCRVDLVFRRALYGPGDWGFGITAYLLACGATERGAVSVLNSAASLFAATIHAQGTAATPASKLQ